MVDKTKIKKSFAKVKKDINILRYANSNNLRYLNTKVKEQSMRIKELERRLAQMERLTFREKILR